MDLDEVKRRVVSICEHLGASIPYEWDQEAGQIKAQDWAGLAEELAEIARRIQQAGNRVAGYAGLAAKRARQDKEDSR